MSDGSKKPAARSFLLRPRFFYSVMAILLVVVLFVFLLPDSEQEHISQVIKLGGTVERELLLPSTLYQLIPLKLRPYAPRGKVYYLYFHNSDVSALKLKLTIRDFPNIRILGLSGSTISDELIEDLSERSNLQTLFLDQTNVSDKGIGILSKNRTLTCVSLGDTNITDESIKHLSKMPQLRILTVDNTKITDASVEFLLQMSPLINLAVSGTEISEDGLRRLRSKHILE